MLRWNVSWMAASFGALGCATCGEVLTYGEQWMNQLG